MLRDFEDARQALALGQQTGAGAQAPGLAGFDDLFEVLGDVHAPVVPVDDQVIEAEAVGSLGALRKCVGLEIVHQPLIVGAVVIPRRGQRKSAVDIGRKAPQIMQVAVPEHARAPHRRVIRFVVGGEAMAGQREIDRLKVLQNPAVALRVVDLEIAQHADFSVPPD